MVDVMRVLVCGGRKYKDEAKLFYVLDQIHGEDKCIRTIIEGEAPGADQLAALWAVRRGVGLQPYPIDPEVWKRVGRSAGPMRNTRMLIDGMPDLVVAFPGGNGTKDMMRKALKAKIHTIGVEGWIDLNSLNVNTKRGSETGGSPLLFT